MRFALAFAFATVSLITAALTHPFGKVNSRDAVESRLNHELDASLRRRLDHLIAEQNISADDNHAATLTER